MYDSYLNEIWVSYTESHFYEGSKTIYLYSNNCGQIKRVLSDNSGRPVYPVDHFIAAGFIRGIQLSNVEAIYLRLTEIIENFDAMSKKAVSSDRRIHPPNEILSEILSAPFIYPGRRGSFFYPGYRYGRYNDVTVETYKVSRNSSNIRVLFYDHIDYFEKLIDLLLIANQSSLYDAFYSSLFYNAVSRAMDYGGHWFHWDTDTRNTTLDQLNKLRKYGAYLLEKGETTKGTLAIQMAEQLSIKVQEKELGQLTPVNQSGTDPIVQPVGNYKILFENLKFKLQLMRELHQHDEKFAVHRGWKHFVANFFSILFTAGIANGIHYMITGNAFFFNKTETQNKVLDIQSTIGFSREERIHFKPQKPEHHEDPFVTYFSEIGSPSGG